MTLDVPVVLQKSGHDCGTAAATALLRYHGRKMPDLSAAGIPCRIDGTPPGVIEPLLRAAGLRVQSGEADLGDLRHHTRLKRPCLCLVQREGIGHWVVVRGVVRGRVYLMDPAEGNCDFKDRHFEQRWWDCSRDGAIYKQWMVVAW